MSNERPCTMALLSLALLLPAVPLQDDPPGDPAAEVPELAEVRSLIRELKLEEAEEALEDGKGPRAMKYAMKAMRTPGELIFAEKAEAFYADLKDRFFYVVNDFETEERRSEKKYRSSSSGASAEIVDDVRLSHDGRHALQVKFDERPEGVQESEQAAWRAVQLEPPDGFGRDLESLKALSFAIFSARKQNARVDVIISGGGASSFALYPGLTLDFAGWKPVTIPLDRMRLNGNFQWRDGRRVVFSTRSAPAMEFIVDDVKFLR